MKKSLLAMAVAAALPAVATAQVTIGGALHFGLQDTGAPGANFKGVSLGGSQNAINIVASEEVQKGLRAGARFQLRYSSETGDVGGIGADNSLRLFHDANFFISGSFGEFRAGKIFEDSNCSFDPWGCLTTGGSSLAAGFSGSVGTLTAAQSVASSVLYRTPNFAGFSASYQAQVGDRDNQRQVLNLSYSDGPIIAQILMTKNGIGNTVVQGARLAEGTLTTANVNSIRGASNDVAEDAVSYGVSYDFKVARVMFVRAEIENAAGLKTRKANQIGAIAPLGSNIQLLAGYVQDDGTARTSANDTRWVIGANYLLSKRTTLGADLFEQEGAGFGTGFALRARHTF